MQCNLCKTSYFHGYKEYTDGSRTFDLSYCQVLLFNSGMAFTFKFLKYMDSMITVGGLSFERATNVYNYSSGEKHSPFNDDRLQAAWFMFRVLNHVTLFPTWPRKDKSYEIDIEKLCSIVYPQLKDQIDTKWIGHKCKEIGCRNGAIVIDGNEKLYRSICRSEKRRVKGNIVVRSIRLRVVLTIPLGETIIKNHLNFVSYILINMLKQQ